MKKPIVLFLLEICLEAKNFPGCDLNAPPLSERMQMMLRERRTGIIMPPMGH